MDFFYDEQVRRYLLQFMRIFSDIKIETGPDENGTTVQKRIPIVYGDPSSMVAQILKGQNENTMLPAPMFSAWIQNMELAPERRNDTMFVGKLKAFEREYDETLNEYGAEIGNRYTIERYMPVPYNVTFQLDLWSTNTTSKLQLLEQIMTIFNPMVQIQQNDNYFDWSSIFEVEMVNLQWTNRTIPQGTDIERDVASMQFKVPVWINPPAKVRRIRMIEQIVTTIYDTPDIPDEAFDGKTLDALACIGAPIDQIIVTPGSFKIGVGIDELKKNEVVLLNKHGQRDSTLSWDDLLGVYGNIQANETLLRLKQDIDIEKDEDDILGRIKIDPLRTDILLFDLDVETLPSTISSGPVNSIIEPTKESPGDGLPDAAAGQRYLLISESSDGEEPAIPQNTGRNPWGTIEAYENDIIEYDGNKWFISFDSRAEDAPQYVVNLSTQNHYKFTGKEWVFTYLGEYFPGYWRLQNLQAILDVNNE